MESKKKNRGVDRNTAKPRKNPRSVRDIAKDVTKRHRVSLKRLAK